jgi:hypothetical protein
MLIYVHLIKDYGLTLNTRFCYYYDEIQQYLLGLISLTALPLWRTKDNFCILDFQVNEEGQTLP